MRRCGKHALAVTLLNHFSLTQHNHLMAQRAHNLQIVADKDIRQLMLFLQCFQ
ncbi:hypothetical protein D3C78_1683270 [compost metagenome]